jgi:uncharacterized protein (TIGR00645 family)
MLKRLEAVMASALIASLWLMLPIYLGLMAALILLGVEFFLELLRTLAEFAALDTDSVILAVLNLIDLVLVANLVFIMISVGLGRLGTVTMGKDNFSGLQLKAVALLVAITAIDLLESFVEIGSANKTDLEWRIAILATFVLTGILLAWMDRFTKQHLQEGRASRESRGSA